MDPQIFQKLFAKGKDIPTLLSILQWQYFGKVSPLHQRLHSGVTANIFGSGGKMYFQISLSFLLMEQ
jgi:hypothetical protein